MKVFHKPTLADLVAFATTDKAKAVHSENATGFYQRINSMPNIIPTIVADTQVVGMQMCTNYVNNIASRLDSTI